jgi:hypothetical protein
MIKNFLDFFKLYELDFNIKETEYNINILNNNINQYEFISKNNNSYSVYFKITKENNEKLSDNTYLKDYTNLNNIPTIFFSLTDRGFDNNFDNLTNKEEFLEVMGKVIYCILEYINRNNYSVYSIGEIGNKKINFYNNYRKYFKDYTILTGLSSNYLNKNNKKKKAYYLIKKSTNIKENILKLDDNCYLKIK